MSDLKIWKAIWEVRFPAAAKLFDDRGTIATKWQGTSDLTEWRISRNKVVIHNKSNKTHLRAEYCVLGVVMEQPENYASFCDLATRFSDDILRRLNVKVISRIGLRLIQIAERHDFDALVTNMRRQLYGLADDDWQSLGGFPVDIGIPLILEFEQGRANFNLGPMEKEQLAGFFESDEVKEQLPSVALFLDLDLYKMNPELDPRGYQNDLMRFMRTGGRLIQETSAQFIDRFGGFE